MTSWTAFLRDPKEIGGMEVFRQEKKKQEIKTEVWQRSDDTEGPWL